MATKTSRSKVKATTETSNDKLVPVHELLEMLGETPAAERVEKKSAKNTKTGTDENTVKQVKSKVDPKKTVKQAEAVKEIAAAVVASDDEDVNSSGGSESSNVPDTSKTSTETKRKRPAAAPQDPSKLYFVGFIHQVGWRKEEFPMKIFASNDVRGDKNKWQEGHPNNLKLHAAIHCKNGDAKIIVGAFDKLHTDKRMQKTSNGWYEISKKTVDEFVQKLLINPVYESVSEAKAKLK
jgi:hypothetical protein